MKTTTITSKKASTKAGVDKTFNNDEFGFGTNNVVGKIPVYGADGSGSSGGGGCCCCCCCCCCGSGAADMEEN